MVAAQGLSEQDVEAARAGLSDGRAVTVWFTPAAVGVPAGGSAKVVSVGEVAEGDFIQVRPTGSRDTMFCSPGELTRTRPPRRSGGSADGGSAKRPAGAAVAQPTPRPPAAAVRAEPPQVDSRAATGLARPGTETSSARPSRPRTAAAEGTAATAPAPQPAALQPSVVRPAVEKAPARGGRAAARPPAEVSITLAATGEGEWTVEVTVGKKRTVRPTPVQPGDVAVAARALPPAVAEAISSSLDAARRRRAEQVERLRAELEAAERALKDLNG